MTSLEEVRAMKAQLQTAHEDALKARDRLYANLRTILLEIAALDETLQEFPIDDAPREPTPLDATTRHHSIQVDGSATDFVLSVVGVTEGGASTSALRNLVIELDAPFTTGALHAAIHRLASDRLIVQAVRRKGASYRLTRAGAERWTAFKPRSRQ